LLTENREKVGMKREDGGGARMRKMEEARGFLLD
jgi:hypothetical protein